MSQVFGYCHNVTRVDLANRKTSREELPPDELKRWVGGTGLGVRYLWGHTPAGTAWEHPDNKLVIATGPLSGTGYNGGGGFSAVGIGPMTGYAGASQANGFFGAYLRRSGIDALVLEGKGDEWVYLLARDGVVEIRDAAKYLGLDTFETEDALLADLGLSTAKASVFGIGPAGENLVRFACLAGDKGHVASKNGLGAVLGAKKVKALVAINGDFRPPLYDPAAFRRVNKAAISDASQAFGGLFHNHGTGVLVHVAHDSGVLPVKNYQTNLFPEHMELDALVTRQENSWKRETCFACRVAHCATVTMAAGPHAGLTAPEPEYEGIAAFGPQIMNSDFGAVLRLSTLADRLGLDVNEAGWVLGFVMEAFQKGKLGPADLDGLSPRWGDTRAAEELLRKIASRQGVGDLLAEGARRAAQSLGPWAEEMAVFVKDGSTPRGHDHRGRWTEFLDTCLSATSTIESTFGGPPCDILGMEPLTDPFNHLEVARANAAAAGWRLFDDCLVVCRFTGNTPAHHINALNAVTGWGWELADALKAGRRLANALRQIKLASGVTVDQEAPSARYGSVPVDGPCQGRDVARRFPEMRQTYFAAMGWDRETGEPLPQTLLELDLAR